MTAKALPSAAVKGLQDIRKFEDDLIAAGQRLFEARDGALAPIDFVAGAVINRSLATVQAFVRMVEDRNPLIAGVLLRTQVDSMMRLLAGMLVSDPNTYLLHLLQGKSIKKLKSRDGHCLTDKFLHEELTKTFSWVSRVYHATSGFVHLSKAHMFAPVTGVEEATRSVHMVVSAPPVERWSDELIEEAVSCFREAVICMLGMIMGLTQMKADSKSVSKPPSAPSQNPPAEPSASG